MNDIPDLVHQCKKEDARAQRELYDRYKARLMGVCRRYTADRQEAQDLLQEAFIKIFTKIKQLEFPEKLESWLIKTTVNTAINYYHRTKKNNHEDINEVEADNGDYELLLSNLSDKYLIRLINELPPCSRQVFNLFLIDGYSHSEVAKMLKIGESTSRSQLAYARQILKVKLNALGVLGYERYT